jgi:hypothetical protein
MTIKTTYSVEELQNMLKTLQAQIDSMTSLINEALKEIDTGSHAQSLLQDALVETKADSKLEIAVKALKWYADKKNWYAVKTCRQNMMSESDMELETHMILPDFDHYHGYMLAEEALAQIK